MRRFLAASLFLVTAQAAQADVITVAQGPNGLFSNGSQNVSLSFDQGGNLGTTTVNAAAGRFSLTATGFAGGLLAFCVDIFHQLSLPGTYSTGLLSDTLTNNTKVNQITWLLKNGVVSDSLSSAAVQLAIWEVLYEPGTSNYAAGTGKFKETANTAVVTAANAVLNSINVASLKVGDTARQISPVSPSNSQRLAFFEGGVTPPATTVPEPASVALLGLGLLGLGMVRRRSNHG